MLERRSPRAATFGPTILIVVGLVLAGCGGAGLGPHPKIGAPEPPAKAVEHSQVISLFMMQAALDVADESKREALMEMYGQLVTPRALQSQIQMANTYVDAAVSGTPTVAIGVRGSGSLLRASGSFEVYTYSATMGTLEITVDVKVFDDTYSEWEMRFDGSLNDQEFHDYLYAEGMVRADTHPSRGDGWYRETTLHTWDDEEEVIHLRTWHLQDDDLVLGEAESPYAPLLIYEMTEERAKLWLYEDTAGESLGAFYDLEIDVSGEAKLYCEPAISDGELWVSAEWTLPGEGQMDLNVCSHPSACTDELGCIEINIR